MNAYECWLAECRETAIPVIATDAREARLSAATAYHVHPTAVLVRRLEPREHKRAVA